MRKCVIIGGGVAGLSAAIRLAELGHPPLLIDAGKYPSHRLCGEFFSPECLPLLKQWEIPLDSSITSARFISVDREIAFELPNAAGSLSRYVLDLKLLDRARALGAEVYTETAVKAIVPQATGYQVHLPDGKIIESRQLMIGTGRLPQLAKRDSHSPKYYAFKAHFEGSRPDQTIEMYCFKGGYMGISPIAPTIFNIACLVRRELVQDPASYMLQFEEHYRGMRMIFPQWITALAPEFGLKVNPAWPNVFWLGDAAGSIPPVCGEGLGLALTTGIMAAEYCVHKNAKLFKEDWWKRYHARFFWGKWLHRVVMSPFLSTVGVLSCKALPSIPRKLYLWTRELDCVDEVDKSGQ